MTCPDPTLCKAGDACAGWCRKPSEQPMAQFYTSTNRDWQGYGPVPPLRKYLVERAGDMALPAGYMVKELPHD